MKTTMLKVLLRDEGVTVLARTTIEVPLARLAGRSVAAMERVRLDPASLGAPMPTRDMGLDLVPLHLKDLSQGETRRRGIVVGASVAQALEYVLTHWVPSGKDEPDLTIAAAQEQRRSRHARIRDLEAALLHKQDQEDYEIFDSSPRGRRKASLGARFVWTKEEFESAFEAVSFGGRSAYLPSVRSWPDEDETTRHAVVVEQHLTVGGHRIPRWDVLAIGGRQGIQPVVWGFQGGRWFRSPFERMDARVLESFEEHGRLVSIMQGDLMASETLEGRFLLRVPEEDRRADSEHPAALPAALRSLPGALLSDSRNPVHIPEDVPVITDPGEAWAVLLRTTSGIFLPDAAPCALPRSFRNLAGAWIVGSVPAGRVP